MTPYDAHLQPGAMFLTTIDGWTGRWVAAAQAFVRGGSRWTHAGIVLPGGRILEGQPGGAVVSSIERILDGRPLMVSDEPIQREVRRAVLPEVVGAREEFERELRLRVVARALALKGTPYSFLDYVALAAVEWNLPGSRLLREYVESSGHLICSSLVDRAYSRAGIELFDDDRFAGDVTPGDLDLWAQAAAYEADTALSSVDPTRDTLRTGLAARPVSASRTR